MSRGSKGCTGNYNAHGESATQLILCYLGCGRPGRAYGIWWRDTMVARAFSEITVHAVAVVAMMLNSIVANVGDYMLVTIDRRRRPLQRTENI